MLEPQKHIIDAESWRLALLAIKRDILDAEPVAALERADRLLDLLESFPKVSLPGETAKNSHPKVAVLFCFSAS